MDDEGFNYYVYIIGGIAAFSGISYGYDTGVISGALLSLNNHFGLSTILQEVIVSGVLVGAVVAAAGAGTLTKRFGRRKMLFATASLYLIGSIVMGFAPGINWLILGRLIVGIGLGLSTVVTPMYLSEIAPAKIRGSVSTLNQLALTFGILLAYLSNSVFTATISGDEAWRWMLGAGVVPAAIFVVGLLFLPESPRWTFEQKNERQAREILSKIRQSSEIDSEIQDIKETVEMESDQNSSYSILRESWVRPALIVAVGIAVLTQFSGVNAILYYVPTILNSIGLGSQASLLGTVGIGLVNFILTIVALFLVDRVNRRTLLLVGLAGMIIGLGGLGVLFKFATLSAMTGWIAVGFLAMDIAFYAISLGVLVWVIVPEVLPMEARDPATSVAYFANWCANLLVTFSFLSYIKLVGRSNVFFTFALICLIGFVFVYKFVPETKGRSLEEIESDLRDTALGNTQTDITDQTD